MIKKEAYILGLIFLGDIATISRTSLLNILVSGKKLPVAVLKPVDCQGHLANGGKIYGTVFCNRFLKHIRKIDQNKEITDAIRFDGASNV